MTTSTLCLVLRVGGGIMIAIAAVWAYIVGFYPDQLPMLGLLALGGIGALFFGETIKDRSRK